MKGNGNPFLPKSEPPQNPSAKICTWIFARKIFSSEIYAKIFPSKSEQKKLLWKKKPQPSGVQPPEGCAFISVQLRTLIVTPLTVWYTEGFKGFLLFQLFPSMVFVLRHSGKPVNNFKYLLHHRLNITN